ncbi:MAG: RND superfamily putative drug exporter [Acidimicrobiales bacterium]|jgi:putative drug exporter of the RND superfamily
MYAKLGRWCFSHPWQVIGGWIVVLLVAAGSLGAIGPSYDGSFEIPESESADGFAIIDEAFGGAGSGLQGTIVIKAEQGVDDPEAQAALTAYMDELMAESGDGEEFEGLQVRSPYAPGAEGQIAEAGQIAYAQISVPQSTDQTAAALMGVEMHDRILEGELSNIDGLQVEIGGAAFGEFEPPESELLGLAFAVVVLIVAMGSVVAMGTTIGVAVLGVGIGGISIALLSNITSVPDFASTIGLMIGLGVGIDYALFIVTRYREALRQGFDPEGATAVAIDTAGRSVIFAGATVVVSLLGLLLVGLPFISGLGYGAAITVGIVMASSVTLLPAALGLVRGKVNVTRWRGMISAGFVAVALLGLGLSIQPFLIGLPLALVIAIAGYLPFAGPLKKKLPARKELAIRDTIWYKWSRTVQARPWAWAIGGTALLLLLTVPLLSLNMGFSDEGNFPENTTTRKAYDILADGFGPGSNGPFLIVTAIDSPDDLDALAGLSAALNATDGVAFASPPFPNDPDNLQAAMIRLQPTTSPQDIKTEELVETLRDIVVPAAVSGTDLSPKVTGLTAANIDFTGFLSGRILIFFGAVLTLSFFLLMAVFRSLMVPLKAVIMNMLSIGAAYGIVVAVFQWGWFGSVFGIEGAPIEPFIPMMMFAIVFGLSMDYEVFLLSRVKEEFERTGDPVNSVADGLAMTARVITAAAAIMVVVFGSFIFEDNRIIKLFGLGLSMAVFIDATLVRMLLVPSTMQLLGTRNWWLPGWLDRILPNLNVEGGHHEPPSAAAGSVDEPDLESELV